MPHFPLQEFLAYFPKFNTEDDERLIKLQSLGMRAHFHVTTYTKCICDFAGAEFGLQGDFAKYALFLIAAHLIALDDAAQTDPNNPNGESSTLAGVPFKAVVGSVTVEASKQNAFKLDDWNWWLAQTEYGRELLAYLSAHAVPIFLNTRCDSVRDLL